MLSKIMLATYASGKAASKSISKPRVTPKPKAKTSKIATPKKSTKEILKEKSTHEIGITNN